MTPSPNLSQAFKFIQLNFWTGRLYYPICKFFEREKPDIFSGQEVYSGPGDSAPDHMTLEIMMDENHKYFDACAKGDGGKKYTTYRLQERVQYCVTMTRSSVAQILDYKSQPIQNDLKDALNNKTFNQEYYNGFLHTIVRLDDGTDVHVLNYHACVVIGGRMGSDVNDQDLRKIADYIATLSGPIIFSGDFNLYCGATSFKPLIDLGLVNLNDVYDTQAARNEFSWKPEEVVSHIFVNKDIEVEEYRVPTDNVSDHLPLVMVARIRK